MVKYKSVEKGIFEQRRILIPKLIGFDDVSVYSIDTAIEDSDVSEVEEEKLIAYDFLRGLDCFSGSVYHVQSRMAFGSCSEESKVAEDKAYTNLILQKIFEKLMPGGSLCCTIGSRYTGRLTKPLQDMGINAQVLEIPKAHDYVYWEKRHKSIAMVIAYKPGEAKIPFKKELDEILLT